MPEENKNQPSPDPQKDNRKPSSDAAGGKGDKGDAPLHSSSDGLPENFKDKSVAEVVSMYQQLEKKLGEQSQEVGQAREIQKQVDVLMSAIGSDPERYKQVQTWVQEYLGNDSGKAQPKKNGESKPPSLPDDTRRHLQNQVVEEFTRRHGLGSLAAEERKQVLDEVSKEFADLVDPGGKKPIRQLLDEVPLDKLSKYLDNAYKIVSVDLSRKKGKLEGLLSQASQEEGSIGSLQSGGAPPKRSEGLSAIEKEIAGNLGISEEKYLKRRQEIETTQKPRRR